MQGEESVFFIKHSGIWCPISCEIGSPISEQSEMISTTTRDNKGWKTAKPTLQSYTISVDGTVVRDDFENKLSYRKLRKMKRDRELIEWQRRTGEGYLIDFGKAHITQISDSNSAGDEITFSMELEGYGRPEENVITDNYYIYSDAITYNFDYKPTPQQPNAGQFYLVNLLYNNYYNVFGVQLDCALKTRLTALPVKGFLANNLTRQVYGLGDYISYCDKDNLVYFPNGFNNDLGISGNFVEQFKFRIYDQENRIGRETTHTINMTDISAPSIDVSVSISWTDGTSTPRTGTDTNVNVNVFSLIFDPLNPIVSQQWEVWNGSAWVFLKDRTIDPENITLNYTTNKIRLKVVTQFGDIAYSNVLEYARTTASNIYITNRSYDNGVTDYLLHVENAPFVGFVRMFAAKGFNDKNAYISDTHGGNLIIPSNLNGAEHFEPVTIEPGVYVCQLFASGESKNGLTNVNVNGTISYGYTKKLNDAEPERTVTVQLFIQNEY